MLPPETRRKLVTETCAGRTWRPQASLSPQTRAPTGLGTHRRDGGSTEPAHSDTEAAKSGSHLRATTGSATSGHGVCGGTRALTEDHQALTRKEVMGAVCADNKCTENGFHPGRPAPTSRSPWGQCLSTAGEALPAVLSALLLPSLPSFLPLSLPALLLVLSIPQRLSFPYSCVHMCPTHQHEGRVPKRAILCMVPTAGLGWWPSDLQPPVSPLSTAPSFPSMEPHLLPSLLPLLALAGAVAGDGAGRHECLREGGRGSCIGPEHRGFGSQGAL